MQDRIDESQSLGWFDELAANQFARVDADRDEAVPRRLYSQPFERIAIDVERPAVSADADRNLAADHVAQPRNAEAAARRRNRLAARVVSPWAMLLAAIAGASAFVLGVAIVSML